MHTEGKTSCVRFNTYDPIRASIALDDLGIAHHCVDPRMHGLPAVMTAYYSSTKEAERLLLYLVDRASCEDKLE